MPELLFVQRSGHAVSSLRTALERKGVTVMPAAFDGISGRLIEDAGFDSFVIGGGASTAAQRGQIDYGFFSLSEMVTLVSRVARVTSLPFLVDIDTGYGDAIHVLEAVNSLERAGAAGVILEDQTHPPRGGHIAGRQLISADEMKGKIRAAVDERSADDFLICARTDARGVEGVASAVRRANEYADAGADISFCDGALSLAELETFVAQVESPYHLANLGGAARERTTPRPSLLQLEDVGYDAALFVLNSLRSAMVGMWRYLRALRESGSEADVAFLEDVKDEPFADWYSWIGFAELRGLEKRYLTAEELRRRYDGAQPGYYVPGEDG